MGRPKSKPRAQRKFAQGAFIPQPHNQPTSTILPARAFHKAATKPGTVTCNNFTAKEILTITSLRKIHPHLALLPVVRLEINPELEAETERIEKFNKRVKKRSKESNQGLDSELATGTENTEINSIKAKKRTKEDNQGSVKRRKYELRNRQKLRLRRGSYTESREDSPLKDVADGGSVKTRAMDRRKAQRDIAQHSPERPSPSSVVDTVTVSDTENSLSDLPIKPTRPAMEKVVSKVEKNMTKKNKQGKKKNSTVLKSASDTITDLQQTTELITEQNISAEASVNPEKKASEESDPELPVNTAPNDVPTTSIIEQNISAEASVNPESKESEETNPGLPVNTKSVLTTSASCSTAYDSTPFKLPDGLVTRTQSSKMNCASQLLPGLQDMLLSTPTSFSYCNVCKRCELISKYKKVLSMLPVSDANEPDILATSARDVYDFDSDDEGLKFLRRGRELVRNVLTTKRLSFWLCNLEMTLKKTMFLDAHKLGTLKRNIQMGRDDVTVNKIISRIDYLNQCLMEDKKELDAAKTKRKRKLTKTEGEMRRLALKRTKKPNRKHKPKGASLDSDDNSEEITITTLNEVPDNPPQGLSITPDSESQTASISQEDNVTIPLVSPPLMEANLILENQEDDASDQKENLLIDLTEDYDSSPSNDSASTTGIEVLGENLLRQLASERRHLVLRLTPLELDQLGNNNPGPKKRCSNRVHSINSSIASTSRLLTTLNADSNANGQDNFMESPIFTRTHFRTTRPSAAQLLALNTNLESKFMPMENLTYRPTHDEFTDPITYIKKIHSAASKYGICKIIPPAGFHVPCHLDDNSMFTTINQYLERLFQRWGQTSREMTSIQTYVAQISNPRERDQFTKCPLFDGVELDLVKLYDVVLENGGIEHLMAHGDQWAVVADQMGLVSPRGKPDHKKLEKLYCKHVLPYESLTNYDREKLLRKVDRVWKERYRCLCSRAKRPLHYQKRMLGECESEDNEPVLSAECEYVRTIGKPFFDRIEECTAKGRTMNLATYRRVAAQIKAMRFPSGSEPTTKEVEDSYWKILAMGNEHVCVLSAFIDTAVDNLGHTADRNEPGGSHPWNLKRLGENPLNVLSFLGKTLSVTEPTLCLNQMYSTNCWHKDPHSLAWMDYMHQGSTKIWYAVAEDESGVFRETMEHLSPFAVQNKGIWLASDTTIVPPALLLANNVKLQRIEQNPGEFIVVFPGAFASSIATGLTISESIYFETKEWVRKIDKIFQQMRQDYEPGMFSNIVMLFRMARDPTVSMEVLPSIYKSIEDIITRELSTREEAAWLNFNVTQVKQEGDRGPVSWPNQEECSICRAPLILSKTVRYNEQRLLLCLLHGIQLYSFAPADERGEPPPVTIIYSDGELMEILESVRSRAAGEEVLPPFGELFESSNSNVTIKIEEFVEEANQQASQNGSD